MLSFANILWFKPNVDREGYWFKFRKLKIGKKQRRKQKQKHCLLSKGLNPRMISELLEKKNCLVTVWFLKIYNRFGWLLGACKLEVELVETLPIVQVKTRTDGTTVVLYRGVGRIFYFFVLMVDMKNIFLERCSNPMNKCLYSLTFYPYFFSYGFRERKG